jgi:hypothetical protein
MTYPRRHAVRARAAVHLALLGMAGPWLVGCGGGSTGDEAGCALEGTGTIVLEAIDPTEHDAHLEEGSWTCTTGFYFERDAKRVRWEPSEDVDITVMLHISDHETGPKEARRASVALPEQPGEFAFTIRTPGRSYYARAEDTTGLFEVTANSAEPGERIEAHFENLRLAGTCSGAGCGPVSIRVSGDLSAVITE